MNELSYVNHGGLCCGSRHLYGFGSRDSTAAQIVPKLNEAGKRVVVILNQYQVQDSPNVLNELARTGFVLTDRWNNSSGSVCYSFTRCDERLPLADLPFEWNGMKASDGIYHGNLTQPPEPIPTGQITVGSQVRLRTSSSKAKAGDTGTVINIYGNIVTIRVDITNKVAERKMGNVALLLSPINDTHDLYQG